MGMRVFVVLHVLVALLSISPLVEPASPSKADRDGPATASPEGAKGPKRGSPQRSAKGAKRRPPRRKKKGSRNRAPPKRARNRRAKSGSPGKSRPKIRPLPRLNETKRQEYEDALHALRTLHAAPKGTLEEKSTECRHELGSEVKMPDCNVDYLPIANDEFLSTDWSLDAPEPPVLGCGAGYGELFTAAGQYDCQRGEHGIGVRLQMLRNLTQFLTDNDIPYVLSDGTLLGAYRHGEIMWWDNDADIVVESKYRQKLLRLTKESGRQWGISFRKGHFAGKIRGKTRAVFNLASEYLIFSHHNQGRKDCWAESDNFKECTSGFFIQAKSTSLKSTIKKGCEEGTGKNAPGRSVFIDIFLMWPVNLPEHTGLHTFGRVELYSYGDIFPVRDCWLGGYRFACPRRTRVVLTRRYHNIGPLGVFNYSTCELQENTTLLAESKWLVGRQATSPENYPLVPSLVQDPKTNKISVYVPAAYAEEVSQYTASLPKTGDDPQGQRYGAWIGDPNRGSSRGRRKGKRRRRRGKMSLRGRERQPGQPRKGDRNRNSDQDADRDREVEWKGPRGRGPEPGRKPRKPSPRQREKASSRWAKFKKREKMEEPQFKLMDADGNGQVTSKEVLAAKTSIEAKRGSGEHLQPHEGMLLKKMSKMGWKDKADTNKDGWLSFDEFRLVNKMKDPKLEEL